MRLLSLVLALKLLCVPVAAAQDSLAVHQIAWDANIIPALGQIADTATIEHFRCLLGAIENDTLFIVAVYEPGIISADAVGLRADPCPGLITVGDWHNHIPYDVTTTGEKRTTMPPEDYCDLSPLDRRGPFLLQIVSVTKDISCEFIREGDQWYKQPNWPPRLAPPDSTARDGTYVKP